MPDPVSITLTEIEVEMASLVGCKRHYSAASHDREDILGLDISDSLCRHINGACGELAVAKLCKQYWGGLIGSFKDADIGVAVQVRTRSKDSYDLLVRDVDNSAHAFVLVTGMAPSFKVWGWIMGGDAKQPQWLRTHGGLRPAHFVPKEALRPMLKHHEAAA